MEGPSQVFVRALGTCEATEQSKARHFAKHDHTGCIELVIGKRVSYDEYIPRLRS